MSIELVLNSIFSGIFIASVLRISTPLILPALGGLITELAGATNIALEGIMLFAAFTGVIVSGFSKSVFLGVAAGIIVGMLIAAVLGFFHLYLQTDVFLAGIAINIFAIGGTTFLLFILTGDKGNTSAMASGMTPAIDIPWLKDIPLLGDALSGHNVFTYLAFLLTWLIAVLLYRTPFGAHLRAAGENPQAAASLGIPVKQTQMIAFLMSGFLAALGGLDLSMAYLTIFQREMTAGRGFIALAAVYLGGRKPWGTLLAAILFGFADALSNQLGSLQVPPQWVQVIPYVVTIFALVFYALQKRAQILKQTQPRTPQIQKET